MVELVYLWVDKYKNIQNQGFNFSPRFTCKYEDGELTIDKKEHVSIFPENINITAIVGENGSGKSTLLEFINLVFKFMPDTFHLLENPSNFLVVFYIDKELFYLSNLNLQNMNIKKLKKDSLFDWFQYYLYLAEEQIPLNKLADHTISIENLDTALYEIDKTLINSNKNRISLQESRIASMITSHYISDLCFELTTFMYIPVEINIEKINLKYIYDKIVRFHINIHSKENDYENLPIEKEDRRDWKSRKEKMSKEEELDSFFKEADDDYHRFLMIWYMASDNFNLYGEENELANKDLLLQQYNIDKSNEKINENEFKLYFKNRIISTNELSEREKEIYFQYYTHYFEFDFVDSKNRRFNDLSHGEQTIFGQLINIYYYSLKNKEKSIIYLFNEPDLSLHPQWQKKYLYEVVELLKKIPEKKYHFIFTTHSPFLLSDLQKENVIFLQDGKQAYPNINTFGANIHTLLSHGFFMKDGLMGEFAKGKIEDVINYLNDKESTIKDNDEAQKLLNIIGEPIIKNQLQRMLDSKRLSKVDEIDKIKSDIKKLAKRLEELEK